MKQKITTKNKNKNKKLAKTRSGTVHERKKVGCWRVGHATGQHSMAQEKR